LDRVDPVSFEMLGDKYGNWKIVEPVPEWIKNLEKALIEIINRRHQQTN
jgi:hypothetical protein